jgi:hypothetical protein
MGALKHCEHCLTFSGIHNANKRCCQVRLVAQMPPKQQAASFARVRAKSGDDVETLFRNLVKVEYQRWKEHRASHAKI